MKKSKGYIIPHTHWDREWRYPIWENRMYLVDMLDELIETLEKNPEYKSFLFDGQVVGIEDYLQVRPEKKETLCRLIAEGRITVGPWYTLPDLYPISGESMVRNLLKGRREAEKLGKCMEIGYESFGWGQPSQLPQIYRGFGIDTVIVSKNVDKTRAPKCEFKWVGADGTSVYATRLGDDARANFFMNAYIHIMNGKAYKSDDYAFNMGHDGQVYHQADDENYINDYFKLESTEKIHPEFIREAVEKAWNGMRDTLMPEDRAMMDGTDSTTAQPQLMALLAEINAQFEDREFVSSSMEEYVSILKEKLPLDQLPVITGEMRDGPTTSLSGNALMTRPHIKTLNKKLQNVLFGGAEPFSAVCDILGERYDRDFLDLAINYMLLSHAHDSINGVTQDKTVDDVLYRLNQGLEIAQVVYNRACQKIIRQIDFSAYGKDDILLVVFNPVARPRREILKVWIDTPQSKNVWDFTIEDSQGNPCCVQHNSRTEVTSPVSHLQSRPFPYYSDRHCVVFETGEIPAGGYQVYRVRPQAEFSRKTEFWAKTRMTNGQEIATSPTHMENELLSVDVNHNGSLRILDKTTGQEFDRLNLFESTGDVGDYWMYFPPYNNRTYTSAGSQAEICLTENGNLQAVIEAKITMEIPAFAYRPANYLRGKSERSEELKKFVIHTTYTLKKGERRVLVKTEIENNCRDHRVSATFATGIHTQTVQANGHFTVDHRDALPRKDKDGYYYNELIPQPFQGFVQLENEGRSFGVVSDCLGEYEARQDGEGTLSLTLFRAVNNIICTEWRSAGVFPNQHGGQLQQKLTYQYALYPQSEEEDLSAQAEAFNVPVKPVQTCISLHASGTLPLCHSFYELTGSLCLSAIKKAADRESMIVRIFNPHNHPVSGSFRLCGKIAEVYETNLNEERIEKLSNQEAGVPLTVAPNKIITLEFVMGE